MSDIASNSRVHPGLDEGQRSIPAAWIKPAELVSGHHSNIPDQVHAKSGRIRPVAIWIVIFCLGFGLAAFLRPHMTDFLPDLFSKNDNLQDSSSNFVVPSDVTRTPADIEPHANSAKGIASISDAPDGNFAEQQDTNGSATAAKQNGSLLDEPDSQVAAATPLEKAEIGDNNKDKPRRKVSPRVRRRVKKLNKKAKAYLSKKRHKSAKRLLEKAIALDPDYGATYRYLGKTLRKLKDPAGARRAYKKYLTLSPNSRYAPSIRKYLKK